VPLRVEFITLFPRMVDAPLGESILGKAREKGLLEVTTRDLRLYGVGKHRVTDDTPYGGGAGMVMRPEPLVEAIEASRESLGAALMASGLSGRPHVVLLDPQGTPFRQADARRLASHDALVFVCGRYEGVDERVRPYVDEQLSVGDFVLTGGEFAALCVVDAVARLRPGVLGNQESPVVESFTDGLLEGPQYTRPVEFRGARVPDVLTSGDHAKVAFWRRKQALARTLASRPELMEKVALDATDQKAVRELRQGEVR
jgi:tRNA (guanine37-N1)-methyltransferase